MYYVAPRVTYSCTSSMNSYKNVAPSRGNIVPIWFLIQGTLQVNSPQRSMLRCWKKDRASYWLTPSKKEIRVIHSEHVEQKYSAQLKQKLMYQKEKIGILKHLLFVNTMNTFHNNSRYFGNLNISDSDIIVLIFCFPFVRYISCRISYCLLV